MNLNNFASHQCDHHFNILRIIAKSLFVMRNDINQDDNYSIEWRLLLQFAAEIGFEGTIHIEHTTAINYCNEFQAIY